jgi:hypothetical protein
MGSLFLLRSFLLLLGNPWEKHLKGFIFCLLTLANYFYPLGI